MNVEDVIETVGICFFQPMQEKMIDKPKVKRNKKFPLKTSRAENNAKLECRVGEKV